MSMFCTDDSRDQKRMKSILREAPTRPYEMTHEIGLLRGDLSHLILFVKKRAQDTGDVQLFDAMTEFEKGRNI